MWSSERGWLKSIRRRLIVALVGGLGSLLVVMFLLLDQMLDHHLYARLDAQLLDRARAVGALLASGTPVDALMPEFREHGHTDFYTIWDRQGGVLARMDDLGVVIRSRMPEDQRRVLVRLSPKGEAIVAQMAPLVQAQYRLLEDALGKELIQEVYQVVDKLLIAQQTTRVPRVALPALDASLGREAPSGE